MSTNPGTVTVWQSGRLAPKAGMRRLDLSQVTRTQWIGAVLLLLSALVLTEFVAVLEQDVARNDLQHLAQRSPAGDAAQVVGTTDVALVAGR